MPLRSVITPLLLLLGVMLWLMFGRVDPFGRLPHPLVWVAVAVVALVPVTRRRIEAAFDSVASPTPRVQLLIAFAVALVSGVYLYATAERQNRNFFPIILDEYSYAIQARMLASGRLWLPSHPAADSFDSAYVIVRPVYASMYFPGAALMLVPAVWLGLPWWVTPLVLAVASAGLLYRVTAELVHGVAGLLAALMLVSLSMFRELSLRLYSQMPTLFLALCLTWAWLAWRRGRRTWQAAVIGVLAGWLLITRPLDALVFIVPIMIAILSVPARDLRRPGGDADPSEYLRMTMKTVLPIVVGAMPFVVLQLVANRGITGSWLTTPHAFYAQRDFPGITFGFHEPRPVAELTTVVPPKRALYEEFAPAIRNHRPATLARELLDVRLPRTASATLPNNLMLILLPLGVAGVFADRWRWVAVAPLPLFVIGYAFYLFYFSHYLLVIAPATILLILFSIGRLPRPIHVPVTLAIAMLAIYALPEFHRTIHDDVGAADLEVIDKMLPELRPAPALVLFRYHPGVPLHREPVYNIESLDVDSLDVIRAHDLPGEPNHRLFVHYAARRPELHVYFADRSPDGGPPTITYAGPVGDLATSPPAAAMIPRSTTQPTTHQEH